MVGAGVPRGAGAPVGAAGPSPGQVWPAVAGSGQAAAGCGQLRPDLAGCGALGRIRENHLCHMMLLSQRPDPRKN
jgi:hypothetical protein